MPFTKIKRGRKRGKYRSPRGRVFTRRQVRLYYATGGFKHPPRRKRRRRTSRVRRRRAMRRRR